MSQSTNLASRLDKLNPFSKPRRTINEDDRGEDMEAGGKAGGGHAFRDAEDAKVKLRVSKALKSFLVKHDVLPEADAGLDTEEHTPALNTLLNKPHTVVPREILDRSHPLSDYLISSSHNTYLMAHQLFGTSSVEAYKTALKAGSRCIEIDAWDHDDNKDEPKVTHGFTLVSNIPFRSVCEAVRDVTDEEMAEALSDPRVHPSPILLSLENHCDAHGQMRLVEIMKEVLGHRLLSEPIIHEDGGTGHDPTKHVRLSDLGAKVAVIVEYHLPDESTDDTSSSSSSDSDSSDEEDKKKARKNYKDKKKAAPPTKIIPELAALGVYAQSVKPGNNSWFDPGQLLDAPHHHLINLSESGLRRHMPAQSHRIARHNSRHLMRVYPKGTRISSRNLSPVPFWGLGAQICALNWQRFDASMQINEALFAGTDGYVLKPARLRGGGDGHCTTGVKKRLRLHVAGATDVPPGGNDPSELRAYLTCVLVLPGDLAGEPPKRKTSAYKQHKLGALLHRGRENPPPSDPLWDETLEWEYEDSELAFLRMLIKDDESFSRNSTHAVAAVRLMYVVPGWSFITMLDLKGRETQCTLLVKFEIEDA